MLNLADRVIFSIAFGTVTFLVLGHFDDRPLAWQDFVIFVTNPLAILILFDIWMRFWLRLDLAGIRKFIRKLCGGTR